MPQELLALIGRSFRRKTMWTRQTDQATGADDMASDERHVCKGCRFLFVDAGQFVLHSALYVVGAVFDRH